MGLVPPFIIGRTNSFGDREWHIVMSCEKSRKPLCGTGPFISGGLDTFTGGMPTCHRCIAVIRRSHNPERLEKRYRQRFTRCRGCNWLHGFSYKFSNRWRCETCWVACLVRRHHDVPERITSR